MKHPIEERKEETTKIDVVEAQVIRFKRLVNPHLSSGDRREPSDWPIGMKVFVDGAGPFNRHQLFLDVGCEDAQGCADAERVVRSLRFHKRRDPNWRDPKPPTAPLPEPR